MPNYPSCSHVSVNDVNEPVGGSYIYCLAAEVRELKRAIAEIDSLDLPLLSTPSPLPPIEGWQPDLLVAMSYTYDIVPPYDFPDQPWIPGGASGEMEGALATAVATRRALNSCASGADWAYCPLTAIVAGDAYISGSGPSRVEAVPIAFCWSTGCDSPVTAAIYRELPYSTETYKDHTADRTITPYDQTRFLIDRNMTGGDAGYFSGTSRATVSIASGDLELTDFIIRIIIHPLSITGTKTIASYISLSSQNWNSAFHIKLVEGVPTIDMYDESMALTTISGGSVPAAAWSLLTLRREGSALSLQIDNMEVATGTFATTFIPKNMTIGRAYDSAPGGFYGHMAVLEIWTK